MTVEFPPYGPSGFHSSAARGATPKAVRIKKTKAREMLVMAFLSTMSPFRSHKKSAAHVSAHTLLKPANPLY